MEGGGRWEGRQNRQANKGGDELAQASTAGRRTFHTHKRGSQTSLVIGGSDLLSTAQAAGNTSGPAGPGNKATGRVFHPSYR